MASSIFGALAALGDFGNQMAVADQATAAARAAAQKESSAEADRQAAAKLKRDAFAFKQRQANAKKPIGTPYVAAGGKMVQRFYDPVSKTITEEEVGGAAPETDGEKYKRMLKSIDPTMREDALNKAVMAKYGPAAVKPDALEQKKAFWKSLGFTEEQIKRMAGVEGGLYARPRVLAGGSGGGAAQSDIDNWRAAQIAADTMKFSDVPTKEKDGVARAMQALGLTPGKAETNQEKQADDATRTLIPMVDDAIKMLANHADETGGWSAFKQGLAKSVYGAGISPGKDEEKILQTVSFLQLLGVQPWTKTGRGKFIFEAIEPHLPKAGDSLGLTYQKLNTLRDLLPKIIQQGGVSGQPGSNSDINVGDTVEVP